jgi:hypothetical protein
VNELTSTPEGNANAIALLQRHLGRARIEVSLDSQAACFVYTWEHAPNRKVSVFRNAQQLASGAGPEQLMAGVAAELIALRNAANSTSRTIEGCFGGTLVRTDAPITARKPRTLPSQETSVKYALKSSSPTPRFFVAAGSYGSPTKWSDQIGAAQLFDSIREVTREIARTVDATQHVTRGGYDIVRVRETPVKREVRPLDAQLEQGERRVGYLAQLRSDFGSVLVAAKDGNAYNFAAAGYNDAAATSAKMNVCADVNAAAIALAKTMSGRAYTPLGIVQLVEVSGGRTYEVLA